MKVKVRAHKRRIGKKKIKVKSHKRKVKKRLFGLGKERTAPKSIREASDVDYEKFMDRNYGPSWRKLEKIEKTKRTDTDEVFIFDD